MPSSQKLCPTHFWLTIARHNDLYLREQNQRQQQNKWKNHYFSIQFWQKLWPYLIADTNWNSQKFPPNRSGQLIYHFKAGTWGHNNYGLEFWFRCLKKVSCQKSPFINRKKVRRSCNQKSIRRPSIMNHQLGDHWSNNSIL